MELVEESPATGNPTELLGWERIVHRCRMFLKRLRRKLPYLVWHDDEVDVTVTFKDLGALGGSKSLVFEADDLFHRMGISFDAGSGCGGRDWEWDYSLSGPLNVRFRGRAKRPEKRTAIAPKVCPRLVVSN